ncbi:hypothetical protein [Burkholderia ubonensis]|uniref:hypothetical protein n=1 Tax=Burkholderia ubonensis TaxID=101571 RepID=UPI0007560977|nr:hypothetical protein [Burkholderia ubonensis]KWN75183.1 hypothetical protein WM23_26550 [Burkholderia ubonensis]
MDHDILLLKARIEALETVVAAIAKRDPAVLADVQKILIDLRDEAKRQAEPHKPRGFPQAVMFEMPAYQDKGLAKKKFNLYSGLVRQFGA